MQHRTRLEFYRLLFGGIFMGLSGIASAANYSYDELHRITKADYGNGTTIEYSYDAAGNSESRIVSDNRRTLAVTADPPNAGTVTGAGATLMGNQASLSATPASGFVFDRWLEGTVTVDTSNPLSFTVTVSRTLTAKFAPLAPEIVIEDSTAAPSVNLVDGTSTLSFSLGTMPSRSITVRNAGNVSLTGISTSITGAQAGDFSTGSLPAVLAPAASATSTITYDPQGTGARAAILHIQSNDPSAPSFDIEMTGAGLTLLEDWRRHQFGSSNNAGQGADNTDSDGDGIPNLLEYAFGLNPHGSDGGSIAVSNGSLTARGSATPFMTTNTQGVNFKAMFGRRKDYQAAGLIYTVQFSGDLTNWSNSTATPSVITDDGEIEAVSVPYPFFVGTKKARFFRVSVSVAP